LFYGSRAPPDWRKLEFAAQYVTGITVESTPPDSEVTREKWKNDCKR
jgi:hypothetical protein